MPSHWPTTDWQVKDPSNLKMDSRKLADLESVIQSDYSNINGIVLVKNGFIAYERYFNGHRAASMHHVASVTKSILSALIGIAINKGFIKHVNQKVLEFFPEYVSDSDQRQKEAITIRHLLTMTAPYPFNDWQEPLDQLCMQPDWITYTLDMLGENGTIGDFKYSTAGAHLLSAIITRSTGKSAREFANEYLFKPIGMNEIPDFEMESYGFEDLFGENIKGWVKDPHNHNTGGWGLTLTTRDMARFGHLYLNNGLWEHNQVIPKSWIIESTANNPNHYGYLWWIYEDAFISAYAAIGDGGNMICCIPEKDFVIAIASEFMINPPDRWQLIKEHIIPAVFDEA
ncbi:serine hydrolase domain-containing protein [Ornithinibacillus xuwenensis]|uniref:Serine hydrolase n=1 Tax=Ornithinibacillus xuwenensis TaxID=3144668 RepID=A0ABU9XKT6_9BACI